MERATFVGVAKIMYPDVPALVCAVHIYKTDNYAKITFSVYIYSSETLGQFLRKLRLKKGLEQWELTRKLRVHKNTVYEWENDRKRPSTKSMEMLAHLFIISRKTLEDFKMARKKGL